MFTYRDPPDQMEEKSTERSLLLVEYREKRLGLMPPATVVLGGWSLAGNSHWIWPL